MQAVDKMVEQAVQLLGWMEGLHFTRKPLSLLLLQPCPIPCPLQIFVIKEGGSRFNWENTPYSKVGWAAQDCRHRLAGNSLLASSVPPCSYVLKAHPLNADLPSPLCRRPAGLPPSWVPAPRSSPSAGRCGHGLRGTPVQRHTSLHIAVQQPCTASHYCLLQPPPPFATPLGPTC